MLDHARIIYYYYYLRVRIIFFLLTERSNSGKSFRVSRTCQNIDIEHAIYKGSSKRIPDVW